MRWLRYTGEDALIGGNRSSVPLSLYTPVFMVAGAFSGC